VRGYNFTENVRAALIAAREAATEHGVVDAEHLLLGLLRGREGVALAALHAMGVEPSALEAKVRAAMGGANSDRSQLSGPDLPYAVRSKHVLEGTMREAESLGTEYVGTEHLLLSLLAIDVGPVTDVLRRAGLAYEPARTAIARILDLDVTALPPTKAPAPGPPGLIRVLLELNYEGDQWTRWEFGTLREARNHLEWLIEGRE
jgi:ATP-dependent Clp protease ATP-binding subunit ClpC